MSDKIRLLIVDDEVKFLQSIAQRLQMRGLEVTTAVNGHEALDKARSQKFDLALLDLKMPGIDGRQVLEVLKRDHQWLEVIILTGHGSIDSAVECTKLGAFDYLPKPYELDNLLQVLNRAYQARLTKKFESDQSRLEKISELALGSSPLNVLRELRKLDDEEK
jgi:DNA-binding NtrC family response regulator